MENGKKFIEDDFQMHINTTSFTEYSQTHPFKYLKQLNNVYQQYNKASGKDFSSASLMKLPWKKFKTISIPKYFQESYNLQRKQTMILRNSEDNEDYEEVEKQRRFWREHEGLMRKYYRNNLANSNMTHHKLQQRRRNLLSKKSIINSKQKNSTSYMSNNSTKKDERNNLTLKQHKEKENNQQRKKTLKTESNLSQNNRICQIKEKISICRSSTNLLKDNTNIHGKMKNRLEKSKHFIEQISVEEEVLQKLKKMSTPYLNRAKTANLLSKQSKVIREREKILASCKKIGACQSLRESRVKEGQYLEYNIKEELIQRYKNKIKQIDCSISQKNVKKTSDILKEMQRLISVDIEDY